MCQSNGNIVSVIIPTYNSQMYVERCIRSIMNQSYRNLEIIIIDDGSKDDTQKVCNKLKKEDSRISYHYQKNSGVSVARNTGLAFATGEWVMFMDVDDQIDSCALEKALCYVKNNNADTVCWNCRGVYDDGNEKVFLNLQPLQVFVISDNEKEKLIKALYYTFDKKSFYPGQMFRAVWGKLLSRKIIERNNILFPIGMPLGEDAAFLSRYFLFSKKVIFVDEPWNLYSILSTSAVGKYRENILELQRIELDQFIMPLELESKEKNTVLINYCIECDRQMVINFRKKGNRFLSNIYYMYKYICRRELCFSKNINYIEMSKKHILLAFLITRKMKLLEAILSQYFRGM